MDPCNRVFRLINLLFISGFLILSLTGLSYSYETGQRIELTKTEKAYIQSNPVITISNEFDWPPFDFAISGKPMGFGIDLMDLVTQVAGLEVTYVNGFTWDELLEMFFSGKIDVIHSLSVTPERSKKAFFSVPYYHSKNVIIYRKDSADVTVLEDLENKIITLPKGWSSIEFFKTHYPKVHIVEVDNSRQALEFVDSGKVAATVEQEGIAGYFIKKFGFTDLKLSKWIENEELQKTSSMHFAVLKSNPVLFNILEKALYSITPEEMEALEGKWFGRTGFEIGQEDVGLTPDEKMYLSEKKSISYAVSPERMPFESIHQGEIQGMAADLMALCGDKLNTSFTLVPTRSWTQSIKNIKNGQADVIPMINITKERNRHLAFTSPFLTYHVAIIVRDDYPFITGMEHLADKKIGMVRDDDLKDIILSRYPDANFVLENSARQCLLDISSGRLEAGLLSLPVASHYIRSQGLTNLKIAGQTDIVGNIRMGVKKENTTLHSILSKVVRSIPQKEIDGIYQKWVVLKFDQQFDYTLLWKYLAAAGAVLLVVIFWNRKLVVLNRKIVVANEKLEQKQKELEQISITDSLTGLYNRRYLDKILCSEIERVNRYEHPLSCIMLDVDFFKKVNDEYGHKAGDEVLHGFASVLKKNIRKTDTLGRWGGEEFLIICPETALDNAVQLAESLRQKIEDFNFHEAGERTASFGVSELKTGETGDIFIAKADAALYRAKEKGRNRVEKHTV